MSKVYIQITSGRGPAECCRAVALVLEKILRQAKALGLKTEVLEREQGDMNRTLFSAILFIEGEKISQLLKEWEGTILWIAQSPYRIYHKRKNWFVAVHTFQLPEKQEVNERELEIQTMRSSGPGGQHVNKTESAVRITHLPSRISVTVSEQRSQLQNKKQAMERLLIKIAAWNTVQLTSVAQNNWSNHNSLQRGNPIKVIREPLVC